MESILKDFGVQPILLLAQILNFLILLVLLKKFLYGPILKVLQKRQETIAQSLKNAEEIEEKLLKTEQDREKKLQEASLEARQILDEATKSAEGIIQEAHLKAQRDTEELFKKGEQSLKLEKEIMLNEVKAELSDLVEVGLKKVISESFDLKKQQEVLRQALKDYK